MAPSRCCTAKRKDKRGACGVHSRSAQMLRHASTKPARVGRGRGCRPRQLDFAIGFGRQVSTWSGHSKSPIDVEESCHPMVVALRQHSAQSRSSFCRPRRRDLAAVHSYLRGIVGPARASLCAESDCDRSRALDHSLAVLSRTKLVVSSAIARRAACRD